MENWFDSTICVTTDSATQLRRLEQRGVPSELARQRLVKQLPLARKCEVADHVLLNDASPAFLREQVSVLADRLLKTNPLGLPAAFMALPPKSEEDSSKSESTPAKRTTRSRLTRGTKKPPEGRGRQGGGPDRGAAAGACRFQADAEVRTASGRGTGPTASASSGARAGG